MIPIFKTRMFGRGKPLLLHADDDPESLFFVRTALARLPVAVVGVEDGAAAVRFASEEIPSLVLLDVLLPGLDGVAVCHELRRNRGTQTIPIFMLSAMDTLKDMEKALAWGANGYLAKPVDSERLLRLVSRLLFPKTAGRLGAPVLAGGK